MLIFIFSWQAILQGIAVTDAGHFLRTID